MPARPPAKTFWSAHAFSLVLVGFILTGSLAGCLLKGRASVLKPWGDLFLNLLFTAVVPLVFFSVSSAVASVARGNRLGRILGWMIAIFVGTGIVASLWMMAGVVLCPPAQGVRLDLPAQAPAAAEPIAGQIVRAFTVSDFAALLSKQHMLALIVFSLLVGLAASLAGEKARPFVLFLAAGNAVMTRLIRLIMLYAPVGLGAYFGYLTGVFGPRLMGSYFRAMALYYPVALGYFAVAFSVYAFLAGRAAGVRRFWAYIVPVAATAWGTGSSIATIPTNLDAARRIGVPDDIRELVIPIGATIHMDGSCLSAILKIAFLFGLFQMDFTGAGTLATAVGVALLSGTVMSGVPGGGFLGELLIVTLYGFPPQALPLISMIGTLVDPPAAMVNAAGDNVAGMLIARILGGKRWMPEAAGA
ncbi:MAG: dicarboxylate/amino acid:cation symporter [Verrucomicrobia bacterium]|nr:dicarboxylate/amino acid:cation symporter [Verrucomicrobiota bacterium]